MFVEPVCSPCRKNGYELSYNQEIVGLGIANFAGAMFSSYTTTGSFSRSAVNNSSGEIMRLPAWLRLGTYCLCHAVKKHNSQCSATNCSDWTLLSTAAPL